MNIEDILQKISLCDTEDSLNICIEEIDKFVELISDYDKTTILDAYIHKKGEFAFLNKAEMSDKSCISCKYFVFKILINICFFTKDRQAQGICNLTGKYAGECLFCDEYEVKQDCFDVGNQVRVNITKHNII